MTDPHIVDPADLLSEALSEASPRVHLVGAVLAE